LLLAGCWLSGEHIGSPLQIISFLALRSFVIPAQAGIQFFVFPTNNKQPAIGNVVINPQTATGIRQYQNFLINK
jgi:hypothetical protein